MASPDTDRRSRSSDRGARRVSRNLFACRAQEHDRLRQQYRFALQAPVRSSAMERPPSCAWSLVIRGATVDALIVIAASSISGPFNLSAAKRR
jgi:hypothetical protein